MSRFFFCLIMNFLRKFVFNKGSEALGKFSWFFCIVIALAACLSAELSFLNCAKYTIFLTSFVLRDDFLGWYYLKFLDVLLKKKDSFAMIADEVSLFDVNSVFANL